MTRVCVLFHNPDDDQEGKLNNALHQKDAYVDAQNRVRCVQFPDGWLVVCYDDEPDDEMKKVIAEKVRDANPQRKDLFIHRTTKERNPQVTREQTNLTLPNGVLAGARRYEYSHVTGDPVYDELIKILTGTRLADLDKYHQKVERKERVRRLSILKHRIAHLFLPIDIDLQGLMETGFREDYWREVVDAWKGEKALNILDQARRLLYGTEDDQDTVEKIVEEAMRNAPADAEKRIEEAWQRVQNLLPNANEHPNSELRQILTDLGCQDKRRDVQGKCQGGTNPFHEWFAKLDEALDELREAIEKAQEGVGGGQTSQS